MKRVLLGVVGLLVVLLGILTIRALTFTLEQPPMQKLAPLEVDAAEVSERLAGALRIRTVTKSEVPYYDPATFGALHSYLREKFPLAHTRLSTETVNRHTLLYTWKGSDESEKPILLMAHQDVVPIAPGTLQEWVHPPFSGTVDGGFIWGRGALDVKSGVVGILEAVERLLAGGFTPKRTIYLAFGHDEEIGGQEGAQAVAELLEERGVRLQLVLDEGGVIIEDIIPDVSVPVALIGVAEKGYVSLELTAKASGGHSSMPPNETAIGVLSAAIVRLEENQFPVRMTHSVRFFEFVGPKMPFAKRLIFANLWLFEPVVAGILTSKHTTAATIRTTTAPTIFRAGVKDNVLPHEARAVVNFRIIPGETPETVIARVREVVADDRVEVRARSDEGVGFGTEPSDTSSIESDGYRAIAGTIRGVSGDESLVVAPSLVVGATDSRHFSSITDDTYRFLFNLVGPDDIARIHGTNERISVDNYVKTIRFYHALISRLAE